MEEKVEDSRTKSCRVGFSIPRNSYPNITTYGVLMDASKYRTKERRENEVKRVKNREKYLLRHLASGRVLCLDNEDARAQLKDFTNETEFVLLESADSKL